jgi:hypothetical protein
MPPARVGPSRAEKHTKRNRHLPGTRKVTSEKETNMKLKKIVVEKVDPRKLVVNPYEENAPVDHPFLRITGLDHERYVAGAQGYECRVTMPGAELTDGVAQEIGRKLTELINYEPEEQMPVTLPRFIKDGDAGYNRTWYTELAIGTCLFCGETDQPCLTYDNSDQEYQSFSMCVDCMEAEAKLLRAPIQNREPDDDATS